MTDERWHRILRLMDEAYADYLTGMASLRGRVVADLKRKLSDGNVSDGSRLEQSSRRRRPAADLAGDIHPGCPSALANSTPGGSAEGHVSIGFQLPTHF